MHGIQLHDLGAVGCKLSWGCDDWSFNIVYMYIIVSCFLCRSHWRQMVPVVVYVPRGWAHEVESVCTNHSLGLLIRLHRCQKPVFFPTIWPLWDSVAMNIITVKSGIEKNKFILFHWVWWKALVLLDSELGRPAELMCSEQNNTWGNTLFNLCNVLNITVWWCTTV